MKNPAKGFNIGALIPLLKTRKKTGIPLSPLEIHGLYRLNLIIIKKIIIY